MPCESSSITWSEMRVAGLYHTPANKWFESSVVERHDDDQERIVFARGEEIRFVSDRKIGGDLRTLDISW